ncbi:MAG: DUF4038 domain-containing protein [Acidobacteria bacterium]|nr:DUF4038 domain-containing protein [Acidobacteriota bacterium]
MVERLLLGLVVAGALGAQPTCPPTPAYSPCDLVFELSDQEAAAHPNPYLSVTLEVEFRSPRYRTFRMPGFWDGGRRMLVRFTPVDPGQWVFRVTSNLERFDSQEGRLTATDSGSPGFLQPANLHHWALVDDLKKTPHLWMGDTLYTFAFIPRPLFEQIIETRARQKFNHLRGVILTRDGDASPSFPTPDQPDPERFRELDQRILFMNRLGIIADLVLGWDENHLARLFPTWQQRERYIRYVVARYAAMHITWQGVQEFEEYEDGRALLKEIGALIKKLDPYNHPRSTHTVSTSAPLLGDGWMNYVVYQSSTDEVGAIERQLCAVPLVNSEFAYEDSGAGRSHPHHVDTDTFRRRLWNATMNGQYPTFGNTGTYGGRRFTVDARHLDSPGARQMGAWFDFFSQTRHWELEPYFDVDGGRAVALEGVEYIVYLDKPGPVEMLVEKHTYQVMWFNPLTGESFNQKKNFKGERFSGEPPDRAHDWVLHLHREGRKRSMLRSYKFESRPVLKQEVEQNPQRIPCEMVAPASDTLSRAQPGNYAAKVTRDTRATRSMMWLWTGEVSAEGQGYRILGAGPKGTLRIPGGLARDLPAVLDLRLYAMNANGKLYSLVRIFKLTE